MPVEAWLDTLLQFEAGLVSDVRAARPPLEKLAGYYDHLAELANGYEKDAARLEESLRHVYGWRDEFERLGKLI